MLINDLESEIVKAKKAAFSQTDIVVNKIRLQELVDKFRGAYPTALKEANEIIKEKERIIKEAEDYANDTMDKATAYAENQISETEIVKKAQEYAESLKAEAIENHKKMDYDARLAAFSILDQTGKLLNDSLNIINDNKAKLIGKN